MEKDKQEVKVEKEPKEVKKLNINFLKNKKTCIIVALSLGTVVLVSAGHAVYKHMAFKKCPDLSSTSLADTLLDSEEQTCFDELIESESYENYINNVNELENSLELKLQLESLGLNKFNKGLEESDISDLTVTDIGLLIEDYQNLKDEIDFNTPNEKTLAFEQTVSRLTTYKNRLTSATYIEMVDSINKYSELLIKSLVVDSLGWADIDISGMNTNLLDTNTDEFKVTYKSELGKKYDIIINDYNSIYYLVSEIRELNKLVDSTKATEESEDSIDSKEFHEKYASIINRLKLVQKFDYNFDNGVMVQEGNNITKKLY